MNIKKLKAKRRCGIAGLRCPCCRTGTLKQARTDHARAVRRHFKIEDRNALAEVAQ